jgi:three-Cys-motif partner protein
MHEYFEFTSKHTRDKQCHFETIIRTHLRAGYGAIKKNLWAHRFYFYADLYAGPGIYRDKATGAIRHGSPLIFAMEAQKHNVPFDAYLFDEKYSDELRMNMIDWQNSLLFWDKCYIECIPGDNAEQFPELLATLHGSVAGHDVGKPRFGLIYVDPPGSIPCFDALKQLAADRRFQRTDILIYLHATNIKRFRRVASVRFTEYLEDALKSIGKQYIHIRQPHGHWTFALLTNWEGMPEFTNIGFHRLDTPEGRSIMRRLNYTKQELREQRGGK